jgi:predicted dehydrogenase
MSTVRVAVVGYGYWGPNLVRNFSEIEGARVVAVCDLWDERLALVQRRYPGVRITRDANKLLADPAIDAVAIATPVSSHFDLVRGALDQGKHVLVEKPLANSSGECLRLLELAQARHLTLMVDHTFIYTSAVQKMKEIMDSGELGHIYYFDSVRTNLGLFQTDVNVIWDLAPHDLSIILFLLKRMPRAVFANGASHINELEDIAYLNLLFDDNVIAHVNVNWLAPVKIRRIVLGGSQKMIVYDDMEASEKVKVYDKGVNLVSEPQDIYRMLVQYRMGSMYSPPIQNTEALRSGCEHFVECVTQGKEPLTSGEFGWRVVQLLEAADRSMKQYGVVQEIGS